MAKQELATEDVKSRLLALWGDYRKADAIETVSYLAKCKIVFDAHQETSAPGCLGLFSEWCEQCELPRPTAYNYVAVWEVFGIVQQLDNCRIEPIAMLRLSKKGVPDEAIDWAIKEAKSGAVIDGKVVIKKLAEYATEPTGTVGGTAEVETTCPTCKGSGTVKPVATGKAPKRFKKPTVAEVAGYCKEKNYDIDAGNFVDFYESKGWKVGKSPMKDWQASVRTWVRGSKKDESKESFLQRKIRESGEGAK